MSIKSKGPREYVMPRLYLSSGSHSSIPLVRRIEGELFMQGEWFLETGGDSFAQDKIRDRLAKCDALIVLLDENLISLMLSELTDQEKSLNERIRFEIVTAIDLNLLIVPLLFDDAVLPDKPSIPRAFKRLLENKPYRLRGNHFIDDLHQLLEDLEGELEFKNEVENKLSQPFHFNYLGRDETPGDPPKARTLGLETCGPSGFDRVIDSENLILADARRKGDRAGEKDALSALGLTYARLGQTEKAIHYFQKQLKIVRELADEEELCGLLANLGDAFAVSGNIEQAKKYYQEQLSLAQLRNFRPFVGSAYNGLGFVCVKQSKISEGIECYLNALEIYKEIENHDKELELLVGIGLNYQKLGDLEQTLEFFKRALQVSRYLENRREEARIVVDLGETCYQLGHLEGVEFYLIAGEGLLCDLTEPWVDPLVNRLKSLRKSLNKA